MKRLGLVSVGAIGMALAGCSVATSSFDSATATGGAIVGSIGAPPPVVPVPPPSMGAFLEGPTGRRLSEADRDKAFHAELDALAAGDRKTWRGNNGTFEYKELPRKGCKEMIDRRHIAAHSLGADGGFVTYDNPETVRIKAQYCRQKGLGVSPPIEKRTSYNTSIFHHRIKGKKNKGKKRREKEERNEGHRYVIVYTLYHVGLGCGM